MSVPDAGVTVKAACDPATKPAAKSEYWESSLSISKLVPPRPSMRAAMERKAVTSPATRPPAATAWASRAAAAGAEAASFASSVDWYLGFENR